MNGLWVSGNRANKITWDYNLPTVSGDNSGPVVQQWRVQRDNEELFTEYNDRAEWGTLLFSGPLVRILLILKIVPAASFRLMR